MVLTWGSKRLTAGRRSLEEEEATEMWCVGGGEDIGQREALAMERKSDGGVVIRWVKLRMSGCNRNTINNQAPSGCCMALTVHVVAIDKIRQE